MVMRWTVLLLILLLVAVLVVKWVSARNRVREPSCGRCGYPVAGLVRLRCPECGADLVEAGIYTPSMRRPTGRVGLVVLWTFALIMGGAALTLLAIDVVPGVRRQRELLTLTTNVSKAFDRMDVVITGWAGDDVSVPRRARIQLMSRNAPVGPALDVDLRDVIADSPWHDRPARGPRRERFTDREILALMVVAGADPTDAGPRAAALELYHAIIHRAAVWEPLRMGSRYRQSRTGRGTTLTTMTSLNTTSAPLAWLVVPVLLAVWLAGALRLIRLTAPRASAREWAP